MGIEAGFGMQTLSCEQLRIMRDFFHLGLIWPNHSLTNSMMEINTKCRDTTQTEVKIQETKGENLDEQQRGKITG